MTTWPPHSNAPITEAIIDIRVGPLEGAVLERLGGLPADEYSIRQHRVEFTSQVEVSEAQQTVSTSSPQKLGYIFRSPQVPYVFQARLDGFTLSRLAPYEQWEPFRDEAKRLWSWYKQAAGRPLKITRVAVRYLNRIDLPSGDLSSYFRTRPEVSEETLHDMTGFLMVLQIPHPDLNAVLNLRQATAPSPKDANNVVSIVLDIDLYRSSDPPQEEEALWNYFEQLRNRKNEIFYGCITPETKRLFD